jgi:hypothetical protein
MTAAVYRDDPRRRLPWLLPMALLLSLLLLKAFHWLVAGTPREPAPSAPVELRITELSPPVPPTAAPPLAERPPLAPPPVAAQEPPALPPTMEPRPEVRAPPSPMPDAVVAAPPAVASAPPELVPTALPPTVTPEMQEVTRDGLPGMKTAPLMRTKPLTAEEWKKFDEIHTVGSGVNFPVESEEGPRRAAVSKPSAPLTAEQRKALEELHQTGRDVAEEEAKKGPIRAARSKPAPPLTQELWAKLDKIYHVGRGTHLLPAEAEEAPLRGALSIQVASDASPEPAQPGGRPWQRSGGMAARTIEQPMPEIPVALRPGSGALVAVARFRVALEGTADVELTGSTTEPKLDQLLLEALRKWRFAPAYRDGRPVASTVDMRLTISAP